MDGLTVKVLRCRPRDILGVSPENPTDREWPIEFFSLVVHFAPSVLEAVVAKIQDLFRVLVFS